MCRQHGPRCRFGFALVLLWVAVTVQPLRTLRAAERTTAAPDISRNIDAVGQLINHSSAATQVSGSGDEAALAKYETAKEMYQRAVEANRQGDAEGAKRLLDDAKRTMFEAVRLAKPLTVVAEKKRTDFNKRLDSLNQLLAAYDRVRKDKHSDAGAQQVNGPVKEKMGRAKALFDVGQFDEARIALDEAFASAKTAIDQLHGGDTVVRSLKFNSKEEEYRYELDRNETHRLLLTNLVNDKSDRPELKTQTQPFLDQAADLRKQAETAATGGDYAKGIELLEQSTAHLIRGIRAAGIYIPG